MVEEHYAAGELVVRQNEVGDRLFIVAQGTAEVTAAGPKGEVPLASLAVGDMFGELALLEPGSLRHATVTAVEPLTALSLKREHVEQLWDSVPGLRAHVDATRDRLLVRRLLKLSRPFATLTGEMLAVLERRVERVRVAAGHDVIRQGESGDRAYLLAEGKAQVIIEHGGAARQLAVLEPGALFGEAALLTGLQRNATVRTILDCDLLVLRRDDFLEIVAADRGAGMKIMQLLRLRDMPLRESAVEVFDTTTPEGDPIRILKNPVRRTYFRLSERGWFIWQRLDGSHNLRDLTLDYLTELKSFAPHEIAVTVAEFAQAGMIRTATLSPTVAAEALRLTGWQRLLLAIRGLMNCHATLDEVGRPLDRLYRSLVASLFTRWSQAIWTVLVVLGSVAFLQGAGRAEQAFAEPGGAVLLWLLVPITVAAIAAHEAAHAFTVRAYGREVPRIGIGLLSLQPIVFVDTSDMWRAGRGPRIMVSLAGIWTDLLIGGLSALAAWLSRDPALTVLLWQMALTRYVTVAFNLNPLREFDGYYVLIDVLDRPNLRRNAVAWLGTGFWGAWRDPGQLKSHAVDLGYGILTLLYTVMLGYLAIVLFRTVRPSKAGSAW